MLSTRGTFTSKTRCPNNLLSKFHRYFVTGQPTASPSVNPHQFLTSVLRNPPPPWSRHFLSLLPFPSKRFAPQGVAETGGEGGGMVTSRSFLHQVICCRSHEPPLAAGPGCRLWNSCQETKYRCNIPVNRSTTGVTFLSTDPLLM